jgi:predicted NBD/HSP70 family sugar kinase
MRMYAGLDIGGKRTAICVIDGSGKAVWRGTVDTHPEMIDGALQRFKGSLDKVGLESGHSRRTCSGRLKRSAIR